MLANIAMLDQKSRRFTARSRESKLRYPTEAGKSFSLVSQRLLGRDEARASLRISLDGLLRYNFGSEP